MLTDYNFFFNGRKSKDLGLILSEYPNIPAITEDIETIEVMGREENLIEKLGTYKNRNISCTFKLLDTEDYHKSVMEINRWLFDVKDNKLFLNMQDRYYKVKNIEVGEITRQLELYGEFTINFVCSPFLFSDNAIIETSSKSIDICNFGDFDVCPIIEIYGNGNIEASSGGATMQIKNISDYVKIDGELKEVTNRNGTPKEWDTIGNFPALKKGVNTMAFSGTVTKAIINYKTKYY